MSDNQLGSSENDPPYPHQISPQVLNINQEIHLKQVRQPLDQDSKLPSDNLCVDDSISKALTFLEDEDSIELLNQNVRKGSLMESDLNVEEQDQPEQDPRRKINQKLLKK